MSKVNMATTITIIAAIVVFIYWLYKKKESAIQGTLSNIFQWTLTIGAVYVIFFMGGIWAYIVIGIIAYEAIQIIKYG